ncbi:Vacuolar protein sorting-associated protein 13C [Operophtera brumata]|uniref:Vacuolar protein sorting-associated protein 13C n=1 Tax=Operophtera brumata TaxID=104452 RepID=A0A0L7LI34_OPEBR|nr:Vacuolar protein sorting-associated protein 13C [Operophtera brumata]
MHISELSSKYARRTAPPAPAAPASMNRTNNRIRRSTILSAEYVEEHPFIMDYLVEVRNIRQILLLLNQTLLPLNQTLLPLNQTLLLLNQTLLPLNPDQIEAVERAQPAQNFSRFPIQGFSRAPFNTRVCICKHCDGGNLIRIDKTLRATILQEKNFYIPLGSRNRQNFESEEKTREDFYIPLGSRACEQHRFDPAWTDISLVVRHVYNFFTSRQVGEMLRLLQKKKSFLNFERLSSIPDDVFHYYIGFSKPQFTEILESTPTILQSQRKPATALATFLVKLHTGEPNQRLCKIFKMARSTLEAKMNSVREALIVEFVPRHLGYNHIAREEVISRRQDPFYWFYRPNDVFILDQSFRDALEELESVGYLAKVPISSATRGAQLSTGDANKSIMGAEQGAVAGVDAGAVTWQPRQWLAAHPPQLWPQASQLPQLPLLVPQLWPQPPQQPPQLATPLLSGPLLRPLIVNKSMPPPPPGSAVTLPQLETE